MLTDLFLLRSLATSDILVDIVPTQFNNWRDPFSFNFTTLPNIFTESPSWSIKSIAHSIPWALASNEKTA